MLEDIPRAKSLSDILDSARVIATELERDRARLQDELEEANIKLALAGEPIVSGDVKIISSATTADGPEWIRVRKDRLHKLESRSTGCPPHPFTCPGETNYCLECWHEFLTEPGGENENG